jgi:hypothetical protein
MPISRKFFYHTNNNSKILVETAEIDWIQINNIWVPKTFSWSFDAQSYKSEYKLNYEWISVNKPVNVEIFMTRGMELPTGTSIVGIDNQKTIQLGKIGDMTPNPRLARMEPEVPRPWWRTASGLGTLASGLAVVLLLVGYWRIRRRRARAASAGSL